jgi:hypothetical protein
MTLGHQCQLDYRFDLHRQLDHTNHEQNPIVDHFDLKIDEIS